MFSKTREIIIVPDENKINLKIYQKVLKNHESHGLEIKRFSDQYNLGLTCQSLNLPENDYHDIHWYFELTKMGHLVIQKDQYMILYLPPTITLQQYQYLLSYKDEITNYKKDVHVFSIYYEQGIFYENNIDELLMEYDQFPIEILYNEINKKAKSKNVEQRKDKAKR